MQRIALTAFFLIVALSGSLAAGFFPASVQRTIVNSDGTHVRLNKPFPVTGMSGVVIHNFGNQLEAVTGYIAQTAADGTAELVLKEIIHHDELPSIKTPLEKGDKVVGGYLYDTVLLLSPDAETYARITDHTRKHWIHPDLFAMFLSAEGDAYPTRENLLQFAREYQVGLVYIVKRNSAILLDPVSGKIVGKKPLKHTPKKAQYPFYMRFDTFKTGIFSDSGEGDYYKSMERF